LFRTRIGFYGSRTRSHEAASFELFDKHSGTEVYDAMRIVKHLGAGLLGLDRATFQKNPEEQQRFRACIDEAASAAVAQSQTA